VLVEGGGEIHAAFLDTNLVDRVAISVAPLLVGGRRRNSGRRRRRTRAEERVRLGGLSVARWATTS